MESTPAWGSDAPEPDQLTTQQSTNISAFEMLQNQLAQANQSVELEQGILQTLRERVAQNIAVYEMTDIVRDKIIEIAADSRQTRIQRLHRISDIVRTTIDDRKLQTKYTAQIFKIIRDTEDKLTDKYVNLVYKSSVDVQNNIQAYLFKTLVAELILSKISDPDEQLEVYANNYNLFIAPSHNDEWQREKDTDEPESGVVENKTSEVFLKRSTSVAKKLFGAKDDMSRLKELKGMKDNKRDTLIVDNLVDNYDELDKEQKHEVIGKHLNHVIKNYLTKGYRLKVEFNRYRSKYSDIKMLVTDAGSGITSEIQINSKATYDAKMIEEAQGLNEARKQLLSDFNESVLSKCNYTWDRDNIQEFLGSLNILNGQIQFDSTDYQINGEDMEVTKTFTNNRREIQNYLETLEKINIESYSDLYKDIVKYASEYQSSLFKSQTHYTVGSVFQGNDDAQGIIQHLDPEYSEFIRVNIY